MHVAIHVTLNTVSANQLYWLREIGAKSGMLLSPIYLSIAIIQICQRNQMKSLFVLHFACAQVSVTRNLTLPGMVNFVWKKKKRTFSSSWVMKIKDWEHIKMSCVISFFSFSVSHFKRQDMKNLLQWIFKVLMGLTGVGAAGKTDKTGLLLSSVVVTI